MNPASPLERSIVLDPETSASPCVGLLVCIPRPVDEWSEESAVGLVAFLPLTRVTRGKLSSGKKELGAHVFLPPCYGPFVRPVCFIPFNCLEGSPHLSLSSQSLLGVSLQNQPTKAFQPWEPRHWDSIRPQSRQGRRRRAFGPPGRARH